MYKPLKTSKVETRFVILEAIHPEANKAPISCRLVTSSLHDSPQYTALSYCWGDPHATVPITVDGRSFPVTKNLEAALREIRATVIGLLWVDAICIDQSNELEKSSQVACMGEIFRKASNVICWLGLSTRDSIYGMQNLRDPLPKEGLPIQNSTCAFVEGCPASSLLESYLGRPGDHQSEEDRSLVGRERLSWDELLRSMAFYDHMLDVRGEFHPIRHLQSFKTRESDGNRLSLWSAVLMTFGKGASDERDKIYALLPLTSDGAEIVDRPDYTKSADEVVRDTFRHVIQKQGQTAAVLLGGVGHSSRGHPSWVPVWPEAQDVIPHWIWATSHRPPAPLLPHSNLDSRILGIDGRIVGTVSQVEAVQSGGSGLPQPGSHPAQGKDCMRNTLLELVRAIFGVARHVLNFTRSPVFVETFAHGLQHCRSSKKLRRFTQIAEWYDRYGHCSVNGVPLSELVEAHVKRLKVSKFPKLEDMPYLDAVNVALGEMTEACLEFVTFQAASVNHCQLRVACQAARQGFVVAELVNCPRAFAVLRQVEPGRYVVVGAMPKLTDGSEDRLCQLLPWQVLTLI